MKVKILKASKGKRLNVLGDNQLILLTGKDTNGQLTSLIEDNEPGMQLPMHVHENEDEFFKVIKGEVEFTADGKSQVLKAGDSIFLPRGIPHGWTVVGDTNAVMHLDIYPAGLENMFEELSALPPGPPDLEKVAGICGKYGVKFV
ncbi:cupin domain-containing protein [Robertkochia marina]|uniref:Cupin domain-containing protein n=1 Tax=Robertkochia marina TaxID=1227945 RepID=A0A4S3M5Z2_9FLAO|nr:cupin domain-containing protein [Robertkochia marina]THD69801.1 cupin domain-containing protein [Robertkochia marina]TRZ46855.1 cupin domain-containing protein [Robertkochia marina]